MNPKDTMKVQRQVKELILKGLVGESLSPKKDESVRMCVDSLAINKITIKYRYSAPRLKDILNELHYSKVFSKIDSRSRYCQSELEKEMSGKPLLKVKEVYLNVSHAFWAIKCS